MGDAVRPAAQGQNCRLHAASRASRCRTLLLREQLRTPYRTRTTGRFQGYPYVELGGKADNGTRLLVCFISARTHVLDVSVADPALMPVVLSSLRITRA